MGQTALLLLGRKACWGFFLPEPANLFTEGQHATSRPKPLGHILSPAALFSGNDFPFPFCFGITWLDSGCIPELVRCDDEVHTLHLEYEVSLSCVPKNSWDWKKTYVTYCKIRTYKDFISDCCVLRWDWLLNSRFVSAVKWTQMLTVKAFVKSVCHSVLLSIRCFVSLYVSFAGVEMFYSGRWRTRSVALVWSEMTAIMLGLYK